MILILSNEHDTSTTYVIEWLEYKKISFFRINGEEKIDIEFYGKDIKFSNQYGQCFYLSEIKSFWYRRGRININVDKISSITNFKNFQRSEISKIGEFIFYKLNQLHKLNSFETSDLNKLIVSDIASTKFKINTPEDFLFSEKNSLMKLIKNSKNQFITKSISGEGMFNFGESILYNYTKKLDSNDKVEEKFFPSLVQNYIEKKYELRIFYLDKQFYSMAIFSQKDNQTSVDFRNYNKQKPNRSVPYKLPINIKKKLICLMSELNIESGSIDMIVTKQMEYVFLEVNPVGQFGMVSYPCNYHLEELISKYLFK